MLREYLAHMDRHQPNVKLTLLLCKDHLRSFYAACGAPGSSLLESPSMLKHHRQALPRLARAMSCMDKSSGTR